MRTAILAVLFLISGAMQGQTFFAGLQMGYNRASAIVSSNVEQDVVSSYSGFLAGFIGEMRFGSAFAVRIEPSFVQKGADVDVKYFDATTNHIYRMQAMDIPVLFQYTIPGGALAMVVFAGVDFSFITSSDDSYYYPQYRNGYLMPVQRTLQNLDEYTRSCEILVEAGLGAEYALHPGVFVFLNLSSDFGMTNLVKNRNFGINGTWKTSDVRLQTGMKFRILD